MDQEMDSAAERQRPTTSSDFGSQPSDALGKLQMAIFIGGSADTRRDPRIFPGILLSLERAEVCAAPGPADRILRVKKTKGAPIRQAQPSTQKQSRKPRRAACC